MPSSDDIDSADFLSLVFQVKIQVDIFLTFLDKVAERKSRPSHLLAKTIEVKIHEEALPCGV